MNDKKHIDRLFQERFKDFEVSPSDAVWKNVKATLETERTKRAVPIWWRYAGVAVIFLLLMTAGSVILNNEKESPIEQVVDVDKQVPQATGDDETNTQNTGANKDNESTSIVNAVENNMDGISINKVASNDDDNVNGIYKSILNKHSKNSSNAKENIANTIVKIKNHDNAMVSKIPLEKQKVVTYNLKDSSEDLPHNNNNHVDKSNTEKFEENTDNINKLNRLVDIRNVENEELEDIISNKDSLSIEEAIVDNEAFEEIIEEEKLLNRWSISPNIAPVYYNFLGQGSHIDEQFIENSKSGEINTSYGIAVSYAINKKMKIRSGIHSVNLSYDTDNVILFETNNNVISNQLRALNRMENIILTRSAQNISALSAGNFIAQQVMGLFPNENAAISQRVKYYEIPVEIQYDIVTKQWGLNLIGGFSTLFLDNNEIFSEFEERNTYIGKANNINEVSFSANIGLGIDYKFSDKFEFNLEPTFKYQVNAYDKTFGNFKPYIIGVYTGFSFKF